MIRVLVVDDELSIRVTLKVFLEEAGYHVELAEDGLAALRKLDACDPDIVVTDVVMPEEDGLGLIRQLRDKAPGIPFIVMSGESFAGDFHLSVAKALGATAVLKKPFDRQELLKTLNEIVVGGPARE